MKPFRFPLESVKTMRGLDERLAREAFSAELRALEHAEAALRTARDRRRDIGDSIIASRAVAFTSGELASALAALDIAVQADSEARQARAAASTRLEQARERWTECRRQLELVGRLEHRARLEHRTAGEKAEQTALDELATASFATAVVFP